MILLLLVLGLLGCATPTPPTYACQAQETKNHGQLLVCVPVDVEK